MTNIASRIQISKYLLLILNKKLKIFVINSLLTQSPHKQFKIYFMVQKTDLTGEILE